MPESKPRKKDSAGPTKKKAVRIGSPRWVAPTMLACFGIGLLWIVAYYIVPDAPFFQALTYWNIAIGFVFIGIGFVISTKWK